MAYFNYRAIDETGGIRKGRLLAGNALELERLLISMDCELIRYTEVNPNRFSLKRKTIKRREIISFTYQLEQLIRSGITLLVGLHDLRDSYDPGEFRDILSNIIDTIESGKQFSEALEEYPIVFDHVYVALVSIGEQSGQLPKVMKDLADNMTWTEELIAHAKKIIIYPTIVLTVVIAVVTFLMIYLVPQLIPFIQQMGGELPFQTKALIWTSEVVSTYWYLFLIIPIVSTFGLKLALHTNPAFRVKFDAFKLKVPLFGPLSLKIKLARFSSYFSLMYGSGVTVLESLMLSKGLMDNKILEIGVEGAHNNISEGTTISESFRKTELFPKLVIRMLQVGEDTGKLDESLDNICTFYNREVNETINKIEPALEPLLTVLMGGLMAWIMIAVLGPVYDIISTV